VKARERSQKLPVRGKKKQKGRSVVRQAFRTPFTRKGGPKTFVFHFGRPLKTRGIERGETIPEGGRKVDEGMGIAGKRKKSGVNRLGSVLSALPKKQEEMLKNKSSPLRSTRANTLLPKRREKRKKKKTGAEGRDIVVNEGLPSRGRKNKRE